MKRHNPTIERLGRIPLFATCTRGELALISSKVTELHVKAGELLIREGDVGREFFVIVEGTAIVLIADCPIARLGPGDFVGELALLDRHPRTATVMAATDLVAQISSTHEFADLIANVPNLSRKLLAGLSGRLRAAETLLAS